ncbi:hypothetical protein AB0442_39805 [Kitasatospora sp. NPDC085895]|uniref:hypothetical protein n=1 Tax=Kitasatospora sp. NPDC085895 TaxID=3155057 RepID=UPI00344ED666
MSQITFASVSSSPVFSVLVDPDPNQITVIVQAWAWEGKGVDLTAAVVVLPEEVAEGDLVIGYAWTEDGEDVTDARAAYLSYEFPFTARPRPYQPCADCDACHDLKFVRSFGHPTVTLGAAGDSGFQWDECQAYGPLEPVLIIRAADRT